MSYEVYVMYCCKTIKIRSRLGYWDCSFSILVRQLHYTYILFISTCPLLSFISLWMSTIFTVLSVHKPLSSSTRDEFLSIFLFLNMFLLFLLPIMHCTVRLLKMYWEKHQYNLHCKLNINESVLDSSLNLHLWLKKCHLKVLLFLMKNLFFAPYYPLNNI